MRPIAFVAAALLPVSAVAQTQRPAPQHITATNGVALDVYGDEFDRSREIAAPWINQGEASYSAEVARRRDGTTRFFISGMVSYNAQTWRFYDSASFRGGDRATLTPGRRDVVHCDSSRYAHLRGCSFMEDFQIELSPADIQGRIDAGSLTLKVMAQSGNQFFIDLPEAHFSALREAAERIAPVPVTTAPEK